MLAPSVWTWQSPSLLTVFVLEALSSPRSGDKLIFTKMWIPRNRAVFCGLSDEWQRVWSGVSRDQRAVSCQQPGEWDAVRSLMWWCRHHANNGRITNKTGVVKQGEEKISIWLMMWCVFSVVFGLPSHEKISIVGFTSNFQVESFDLCQRPPLASHLTSAPESRHCSLSSWPDYSVSRILPLAENSWQCFNYHRYLMSNKARRRI